MEGFSTDFPGFSDGFSENSGFGAIIRGGSSSSSLLVLDSERGELVMAPARLGPNEVKAEKAMVALKNHSEAERRRRGRINAHLATLRGIIPGTKKMDKASLLGEVVSHLKELKRTAAEISKGFLVPMDIDEVRVEQQDGGLDGAPYSIKASLCCDYKPGVLSDLRRALDTLHVKTVRAEIATLGGRMKNVFVMTGCKDGNLEDTEMRKLHANSVHQALRSVLDKFPASQDFSSRSTSSNKRQRISIFNSSSSSPFGDFCRQLRSSTTVTGLSLSKTPMALWAPAQNVSVVFSANGSEARMRGMWRRRDSVVVRTASSEVSSSGGVEMAAYEEGQLERPNWTGETPLSRLVGAIISFKPLYSVLKLGARQVLISTAEKTNIPWREMTREILESDVYKEMESIENPSVVYPDYYLNPFHAYDEGNLSWLAAAEAEAATMSMVRRATPDASSLEEANKIVRGNWLQAIEQHHLQFSGNSTIRDILDVGCSVGVSTRFLADKFPSAKVTGLDLSPYFLAVAQFKEKKRASRTNPINWVHANGEDTGLPSESFDIVSMAYVLHECPARAIVGLVKESFRLLRPGGTIALTDNSPKSKVLQELSPVLFTLMKSTEPFLDEYYLTDLEGRMREAGFVNVTTVLTDKRHRTLTGTVPL